MKRVLGLILSCNVAASLHAVAPHPSMLTVKVDTQMLPVAKVIGTDPVVEVDGKEKRIRTEPTYLIQRADSFGAGFVQLDKVNLTTAELKMVAREEDALEVTGNQSSGDRFGTAYYDATFTSKTELKGGFAAVVIYSSRAFAPNSTLQNSGEVIVHALPDLPAGQPVPFKITAAIPQGQPGMKYFVQIFDASGREVVTNKSNQGWEYYSARERFQLAGELKRYLARQNDKDHAAVPVMMARPLFKEGTAPPKAAVMAILTVEPDGTVSHVTVEGVDDESVRKSISEALGGWLFLPQLKGGSPVAAKVKVPLQS